MLFIETVIRVDSHIKRKLTEKLKNNDWKISLENPIHKSLEDVFQKAGLSTEEKNVFIKYRRYSEFWLLRSKVWYSKSFNVTKPNFIKRLARVLIKLNSSNVSGGKDKLVKDMFSDKSIHKFIEKQNGRFRSKQNSNKIENTYFELEIMSFFIDHKFKIELASHKELGIKIPEFIIIDNDINISIEAKQLNIDSILDNIFGDQFTSGFDKQLSELERDDGYKRIQTQLQRNYENAIMKLQDIDKSHLYLIFISVNHSLDHMGQYCWDYIEKLPEKWTTQKYKNLIGIIITEPEQTLFIENRQTDSDIINKLKEINIIDYHNYSP